MISIAAVLGNGCPGQWVDSGIFSDRPGRHGPGHSHGCIWSAESARRAGLCLGSRSGPGPAWVRRGLSCLVSESPYYGQPVLYHTSHGGSQPLRLESEWALSRVACVSPQVGPEFQVKCQLSFQVKCSSQPGPCLGSLESAPALSRAKLEPNEGLRCQFTEWRIALRLSKLSGCAFWSANKQNRIL